MNQYCATENHRFNPNAVSVPRDSGRSLYRNVEHSKKFQKEGLTRNDMRSSHYNDGNQLKDGSSQSCLRTNGKYQSERHMHMVRSGQKDQKNRRPKSSSELYKDHRENKLHLQPLGLEGPQRRHPINNASGKLSTDFRKMSLNPPQKHTQEPYPVKKDGFSHMKNHSASRLVSKKR